MKEGSINHKVRSVQSISLHPDTVILPYPDMVILPYGASGVGRASKENKEIKCGSVLSVILFFLKIRSSHCVLNP